jgi:hypothetical protein
MEAMVAVGAIAIISELRRPVSAIRSLIAVHSAERAAP